jgi:hypothetical protein
MDDSTCVGHDFAHAIAEDDSWLAYVELLNDANATTTVTAFVARALAWFREPGVHTRRLMTCTTDRYTICAASGTSSIYRPTRRDAAPTFSADVERFS